MENDENTVEGYEIQGMFHKEEKWICKGCAWSTIVPPNANPTFVSLVCPECEGTDFYYSTTAYFHE